MRCPFCNHEDTQVKDSRPSEDGSSIRRRRFCPACNSRFTTFERVQLRELTVLKTNGEKRPFDRDKISRSMAIALRKRILPVVWRPFDDALALAADPAMQAGYRDACARSAQRILDDALARAVTAGVACETLHVADGYPAEAIVKAMKAPSRPAGLPEGVLEGLPEGPGVYFFYGENDLPIYIGKSVSLRSRVMSHFSADHRSGKEAKLAQQVRRVEWQQTAGELGALLLEARLVKERKPTENRLLRETDAVFGLRFDPTRKRGPVLVRELLGGGDPADWADVYGSFRTKKEADNALRELATLYKLCPRRIGTEPWGDGACLAHQMKRCAGVCAGRETHAEHDERLLKVLESLRLRRWPWAGPVAIREYHADTGRSAVHLVDRWCLLGTAEDEASFGELLAAPPARAFDLDTYRILVRWLDTPEGRRAVTVVG